jgi:hypothetical protein
MPVKDEQKIINKVLIDNIECDNNSSAHSDINKENMNFAELS